MDIPVHVIGTSPGVLNGGNLRRNRRKLRVKALPENLPDFLEADISKLRIGSKLYITELENEGFKFLHSDNTVVCQVKRSRTSVDDELEEEKKMKQQKELLQLKVQNQLKVLLQRKVLLPQKLKQIIFVNYIKSILKSDAFLFLYK